MKYIFLILLIITNFACASNSVTVKLLVVNDDKQPVDDVKVRMGFLSNTKDNDFSGYTDSDGRVEATSDSLWGIKIYLEKSGFYKSFQRVGNKNQEIDLTIREIKNPVPMYARKVRLILPSKGRRFGFDFEKSDWVVPNGKGVTAHIYFKVEGDREDLFNYDEQLKISFPNDHDGIIKLGEDMKVHESTFQFPYNAPVTGYMSSLVHKGKRKKIVKGYSKTHHKDLTYNKFILGYILRVNTELDDKGNITSANYGKISGEFTSRVGAPNDRDGNPGKGYVSFTYYYNPVKNERSLEFDRTNNLFKNLFREEQVTTF